LFQGVVKHLDSGELTNHHRRSVDEATAKR